MITPRSSSASKLTWLLCDLVSGRVLTALPIAADETIKRRIAAVEQITVRLPLNDPRCPADWLEQLSFGRTMLVLTVDGVPTQGWFVEVGDIGKDTVPLTLKTLETCLERTFVPDYDQGDADDAEAAAALCEPLVEGFGFTIDATATGASGGGYWEGGTEDTKLLDALNSLMTAGRIEWRLWLDWADHTRRRVTKTVEISKRIGAVRQHVVFDRDAAGKGTIADYTRTISYAAGKGATVLQGVGDGSGAARPMTEPQVSDLVAQGWPRWAERKTLTGPDPEAGLDDEQLLAATLALFPTRERGTTVWSIVGTAAAARPGRDYAEGDTVQLDVSPSQPLRLNGPSIDPVGGRAAVRVIGWELDTLSGQGTPLLWEDGDDG